jgi:peptidoglycan L-alanyl-D-glutamate endopeptidase CwlK
MAVDVVPYPLNWKDIDSFKRLGYFVVGVAHGMGINVKWGADWNMDMDLSNETFLDYPHYELVNF